MMKRRQFINHSLLSLASATGVQFFGLNHLHAQANQNRKKLFVVFMRGGFDGLLALPSLANYNQIVSRRGVYNRSEYRHLDHYGRLFLVHQDLQSLVDVQNGIALFPHSGSNNPSRSHFEQMDIIEGGVRERIAPDGYLSRAAMLRSLGTVSIGSPYPKSLRGDADPLVVSRVASLAPNVRSRWNSQTISNSSENLGVEERLRFLARRATIDDCPEGGRACLSAHQAAEAFGLANLSTAGVSNNRFDLAAEVSLTDLRPNIITLTAGGWDTHDDARDRMTGADGLMRQLSEDVRILRDKLIQRSEWDNSVIVLMSEFGRTIPLNRSGGFDHGRGGLMMVLGGRVHRPSNTNPYLQTWDLGQTEGTGPSLCFSVRTDYRQIMAQIFIKHLGYTVEDMATIFPGMGALVDPGFYS
jgi:uncharacterized protein (DUF1501 family)